MNNDIFISCPRCFSINIDENETKINQYNNLVSSYTCKHCGLYFNYYPNNKKPYKYESLHDHYTVDIHHNTFDALPGENPFNSLFFNR